MKSRVRLKLFLIGGVTLLLLGCVVLLAGMIGKAKPIPPEKIVSAERGDIARSVVARGKIEPLSKVEVKSKANGIIKALLVDVGDRVTEGQILAELDKEDLEAQVREAKATRDGEEANLHAAIAAEAKAKIEAANPELEFARRDFVRASGAVQTEDRFAATTGRRQPRSRGVQEPPAIAGCHRANGRRPGGAGPRPRGGGQSGPGSGGGDSPLCHDSRAHRRHRADPQQELGDAVSSILNMGSAATLIMTLGDVSSVYIKGEVDEADIGKADCGQHVRTKVEAYPNESFEGVVKRIAPMGKELNNVTTFEVRVSISNPQGKLRANMTANAEIVLEERKNVLLVPEAALVYDKDKNVSVQRLDPATQARVAQSPAQDWHLQRPAHRSAGRTQGRRQAGVAVTLARRNPASDRAQHLGAQAAEHADDVRHLLGDCLDCVHDRHRRGFQDAAIATCSPPWAPIWSSSGRAGPPNKPAVSAPDATSGSPMRTSGRSSRNATWCGTSPRSWPAHFQMRSRFNSGVFSTHGITPIYQQIRSMKLADGRLISEADMQEERAVCVIGDVVKQQLFAGREAVGAQIYIGNVPFTVIGETGQEGPEQLLQRVGRLQGADPLHGDGPAFPRPAAIHRAGPY